MAFKDPIVRKEYDRIYYQKNKEHKDKKAKKWHKDNRERNREICRKSYQKHKVRRVREAVEYERKKLKTDITLVIKKRLRARLKGALKKGTKSKSTMELLGIPHVDFLMIWLECKFKEGMTWKNTHLWHIDHIIPCSSFDLTKPEEQSKCFHYTNLQPLWARENLAKGSKIS
jgi:hypothetical protein